MITHKVKTFCLTSGNLRARQMAEIFLGSVEEIAAACGDPGPFLYAVSLHSLRRLDLE